jgi:pantoate--beta-alanine ligase
MSSRNARLNPKQRQIAPLLFQALSTGRELLIGGERQAGEVKRAALAVVEAEPEIRVEYLEVVDPHMQPVERVSGEVRIAAAVWIGATRLIDNLAFNSDEPCESSQ